mmetsp:Transcript_10393/g.10015  ORF Transcript_10393/g.10015 Transcript_10393/m.10015 type:complete len:951 (-) Transcript_10393:1276-4128(-)
MPDYTTLPVMHMFGYVIVDNETYILNKVLFDTGSNNSNFISKQYIDKYIAVFEPFILKHNSDVKLGDSTTVVHITHIVTLRVSFLDNNSVTHDALLNFNIMPMSHLDMIIGINTILFSFFDLFIDMIRVARKLLFNNKHDLTSSKHTDDPIYMLNALTHDIPIHSDYIDCVPAWPFPLDEMAQEDIDTPEPCSYTLPLETIGVDRQTVLDDYYKIIIRNTDPELIKAVPDFLKFMTSDIALAVFCPVGWYGISGIEPIELSFNENLPATIRPPYIPVKPKLLERFTNEMNRLCKYMYFPSRSNICSPIVIAPKGDEDIRVCGSYKKVNSYCKSEQAYIPIVIHELQKAAKGRHFGDCDMRTAFHQVPLGEKTSNILSILTPLGTFRPAFLPEGCKPASGILNTIVTDIFKDFLEHVIVIFDNFLSIATSYEDFHKKHVAFITRCYERNVILGAKKSLFGWDHTHFFGYHISKGKYSMTDKRKEAVTSLVFPSNTKKMQSLLGACLFFMKHIPFYAEKTAPLHEMCCTGFSFDPKTWTKDYVSAFEVLKKSILAAISITIPNFDYTFILRTDASDVAWGGILLQVTPEGLYECINLCSGKFTDSAFKWDIQKKEACAIKLSIEASEYILRGKYFIIETDNKNMLYMGLSLIGIVVRWRVYIQSFHYCLRHLLAKYNTVSDWLIRQHNIYLISLSEETIDVSLCNTFTNIDYNATDVTPSYDSQEGSSLLINSFLRMLVSNDDVDDIVNDIEIATQSSPPVQATTLGTAPIITLEEMFRSVHGGRMFHKGIQATYSLLNEKYPGHIIPLRVISEFVKNCSTCQKARVKYGYSYPAETLYLKPEHSRKRVGVDTLTITPADIFGNSLAIVVVELYTKFVSIYPCSDHTAVTTARALFQHAIRYGKYQQIISDPGSDFMSETLVELHRYLGQERLISLVDRHESNGSNRLTKRY